MLPSPYRLPALRIQSVLQKGRRTVSSELQIISLRSGNSLPRFAFVVSAAIDKRATARNRMKRLLRESVRHLLPNIAAGYDMVFLVRRRFADRSEKEVEVVVRTLLQRAGMVLVS